MKVNPWNRVLKGLPGWIVFGMGAVWFIPLGGAHLLRYPLVAYWDSHLLYMVLLAAAFLVLLGMNALDLATDFWRRAALWLRILILCGGYAFMTACNLTVLLTLDAVGILHYYGGDPEGSAGMLLMPSAFLWLILGGVSSGLAFIVSRFNR